MNKFKLTLSSLLVVTSILSAGCATRVNQPVSDELRETEGKYDGRWVMHRLKSPRRQEIGRELFNCPTEAFEITADVRDGVLRTTWSGTQHTANVDDAGRFRMEIPTDRSYKRKRGANANKSEITYILQGSLAGDDPNGLYTIGTKRLNNQGCEARMKFYSSQLVAYNNSYKGLEVGISKADQVETLFGVPVTEKKSNKLSYQDEFTVFFNDRTGAIDTITIFDPEYSDANGLHVGDHKKLANKEKITGLNSKSKTGVDFEDGIIYWFDDEDRIETIVLVHEMLQYSNEQNN